MNNYHKAKMHYSIGLVILLMAGLCGAEFNCSAPIYANCQRDEPTFVFPGTEDELHSACTSMMSNLDCVKDLTGTCEEHKGQFTAATQIHSVMQDVCDENSPYHRAIADNLLCMKNLFAEPEFCVPPRERDEIETYAETMKGRGIAHLGKSEEKSWMCMHHLYSLGCTTARVGKECGDTARNAALQLQQRFLGAVSECREEVVEDFPAVVELFEAVENKV